MTTRTVTAMFETRASAEKAGQALVSELGVDRAMIRINPGTDTTDTDDDNTCPCAEKGFFVSLMNLSVSDEDRFAYAEGMRRGNILLSAQLDERLVDRASDILERAGAINLDEQEATWRKSGWAGYDAAAHSTMRSAASIGMTGAAGVRGGPGETLKVVEERLTIGKRAVEGGRVRVRSYIVEQPVEEQVTLHEERIHVERHPVDRAATAADVAAFQERTIEAPSRQRRGARKRWSTKRSASSRRSELPSRPATGSRPFATRSVGPKSRSRTIPLARLAPRVRGASVASRARRLVARPVGPVPWTRP